ncbi:STAS domain-containing protein [Pararhodospirillum photometricum]|nr:STAS domain-containing protein [Pararhodospirillum photometricum]
MTSVPGDGASPLMKAVPLEPPAGRGKRVRFVGACTIAQAEEIRDTLLEALASCPGEGLVIACDEASEVDLTFIQILIAARRSGETQGKSVTLAAPAQGALAQALVSAGLAHPGGVALGWVNPFWAGE